jgi:hypothetical protein
VFAREINAPLTGLVKELDKAVNSNSKANLAAFTVFLTDNREKLEPKVTELAKSEKISKVPLTIVESVSGPEHYKVAKDAEVTVILYSKNKTKANFSFEKGKLDEKAIKEVVAGLTKITDSSAVGK